MRLPSGGHQPGIPSRLFLILCVSLLPGIFSPSCHLSVLASPVSQSAKPPANLDDSSIQSPLIPRLEKTRGKRLSQQQKQQITLLSGKAAQEMRSAQERLAQSVASITGIGLPQARAFIPSITQPAELDSLALESLLDKSLTAKQLEDLKWAGRKRDGTLLSVRERLINQLAQITGLSGQQVRRVFQQTSDAAAKQTYPAPSAVSGSGSGPRPSRGSAADISGTSGRSGTEIQFP